MLPNPKFKLMFLFGWKCLHSVSGFPSSLLFLFPLQSGEIDVVNHTTGDRCHLKFAPYSYFSRDVARKVRNMQRMCHLFFFSTFSSNIVLIHICGLLCPPTSLHCNLSLVLHGSWCSILLYPSHLLTPLSCSSPQVTGVVMDKDGKAHYVLSGTWDEKMEFSRVMQSSRGGENGTEGKQKTVYQTLKAREVWRRNPLL